MKLEKKFIEFCSSKKLEINSNEKFQNDNFDNSFLSSFFKKESKLGFYLYGDVGVGKTMILDFFFKQLEIKKTKVHFNEFMISFHDFMFNNDKKDKAIDFFVNNLRDKVKILFFDEFH